MTRTQPEPGPTEAAARKPTVVLTAVALALAMVAAACGGGSDSDAATTTAGPNTTEAPATTEAPESSTSEPEAAGNQEEAGTDVEDLGYLAAEDVDDYIAAFLSAKANSYLAIDDEQEDLDTVSPGELFTLTTTMGNQLILTLGETGIGAAALSFAGEEWELTDEPEYLAVPDELDEEDGEGDVLHVTFDAVNSIDPTVTVPVELVLDVNLVGGGDSVVEVRDNYALLAGTLGTSTYIQLEDIIATEPDVDTLVLTSVAGSENDDINVHTSRLIREAGWTTWVPANGDISSGGVDMFTAGVERYVEPGGFVGVHSWSGDDGVEGSDFPPDHPAHRSQLEYFSEMLGPEAGPDFYFYTLEAAPADRIHRMSEEEVATYGLSTGQPDAPLPTDVVGEVGAGYLELAEGVFLKLLVSGCSIEGTTTAASLISFDLGTATLTADDGTGEIVFDQLDPTIGTHPVSNLTVDEGAVTATVDANLGGLIDGDTSEAELVLPCEG